MKKILLVTFAVMMLATVSFAAWTPTPLEITVDDEVFYAFDGSTVDIPVNVSGKPAKAWLVINTMLDEADKPVELRNGHRGWHYVNGIDTTVYISGAKEFTVGSGQKFTWDGMGTENMSLEYGGNIEPTEAVAEGKYSYYVFAYDNKNPRERVCNYICISFYWHPQYTRVGDWNDDGTPRANPYLWGNVGAVAQDLHADFADGVIIGPDNDPDNNNVWNSYGPPRFSAYKFPIGSDPDDMAALKQTMLTGMTAGDSNVDPPIQPICPAPVVFDPTDENIMYVLADKVTQKQGALFKWTFVDGGDAIQDDGWGGWDDLPIKTESNRGFDEYDCATSTDGNYIYIASPGRDVDVKWDKFYVVDFDGFEVNSVQVDAFYEVESPNKNGYMNRMFAAIDVPNQAVMGGEQTCMMMMVHTDRIANFNDSFIKWENGNGDFFLDFSWDPAQTEAEVLWLCNTGAYRTNNGGRRDEQWFDSNGFIVHHPDYQGTTSIVVYTQDGSGIDYAQFVDDTVSSHDQSGAKKGSGQRCDNGTIFDGMYVGFTLFEGSGYGWDRQCVNWVAQDSAGGMITNEVVGVEEAGQVAFSVDAAYPNPANPTTTIGFTLAEAGHVSVDIYNVAGQKVDTLVDGEMSIGSHSVVWDASQFAAGVYFYTVKSGNYAKTMKVTLLK
jgi:hypothetical protein